MSTIKSKAFPKLSSPFILAPMAGINDAAFRLLCKDYGAGLVYTEMVSVNSIVSGNKGALAALDSTAQEKPVIVQLFGQDTENIVEAAKIIAKDHDFDAIDLNLGCPATNIIREGAGSALLNRPSKVAEIFSRLSAAVDVPITAKIRAGISFKKIVAVNIAKIIADNGASAIAVHARVAVQGYSGKAEWKHIKDVKDSLKIPVIGNGDVSSPEDAIRMMKETGCHYVMIGRAARGNPMIFKQCNDYLKTGKYSAYTAQDRKEALFKYLEHAKELNIDFRSIKVNANYFTKGLVGGARIREALAHVKSIEEVKKLFN